MSINCSCIELKEIYKQIEKYHPWYEELQTLPQGPSYCLELYSYGIPCCGIGKGDIRFLSNFTKTDEEYLKKGCCEREITTLLCINCNKMFKIMTKK